jgi:DNA (cytosine-5)-methyltransferase 1
MDGDDEEEDGSFTQYELHNFSFYKPHNGDGTKGEGEMAPLNFLQVKSGHLEFRFDGVLVNDGVERYVQNIPLKDLSVGGYELLDMHDIGGDIWVQSSNGKVKEVWYKLIDPSPEYVRYYEPFVWLANLSKHVYDYLFTHERVGLSNFEKDFHSWMIELHGSSEVFQIWFSKFGRTDFRSPVASNIEFLMDRMSQLEESVFNHPLWSEAHPKYLEAIEEHDWNPKAKTVVTPLVYECFQEMFPGFMDPVTLADDVKKARQQHEGAMGLTQEDSIQISDDEISSPSTTLKSPWVVLPVKHTSKEKVWAKFPDPVKKRIKVGDVVAFLPDEVTVWKSTADLWYGLVQGTGEKHGRSTLDIIWLYHPSDTTISNMYYPWAEELFMSDNCTCDAKPIYADEALGVVPCQFFAKPEKAKGTIIVKQKYLSAESAFVTMKEKDLFCEHKAPLKTPLEEVEEKYVVGDTVYILRKRYGKEVIEPVEILKFHTPEGKELVRCRYLKFRNRDFPNGGRLDPDEAVAKPNELVYTDDICEVNPKKLVRRCHVRFYTPEDKRRRCIPAPYCRDGTADSFYIMCRSVEDRLQFIDGEIPHSLKQGFDPTAPSSKPELNGMDLYCGGGSFGRGLEEGGAVRNKWAVDVNKQAVYTYNANKKDDDLNLYFGSVNDILRNAIRGKKSNYVPSPGQVDFISAGSPCQGFSSINCKKGNDKGLRNCSLVASVASYVDFYRPRYAVLENVITMAKANDKSKENVLSQMIAVFVAMGYQVQQWLLDAWNFGSPQSRSRLFIVITAPGENPPPHPPHTHDHPQHTTTRKLGQATNGLGFGERKFEATPFRYVTASEMIGDLPDIGDGRVATCINYPDHRTSRVESHVKQTLLNSVMVHPRRMGFVDTMRTTVCGVSRMSDAPIRDYGGRGRVYHDGSRSWSRIDPNRLMPTVTTALHPSCNYVGYCVHYEQHRCLTVQEARRAQNFPDHEVLIGSPANQYKIVGNSVSRAVALALGLSLREAWFGELIPVKKDTALEAENRIERGSEEVF